MRTNVYIDGFNLYYGALKGRPHCRWLDLDALSRGLLIQGQTLNRIRYFTAAVGVINDPNTPVRQQTYLRALATIPHLTVHRGQFKINPVRLPLASNTSHIVEVVKTEVRWVLQARDARPGFAARSVRISTGRSRGSC
jgi:hypothetical protein